MDGYKGGYTVFIIGSKDKSGTIHLVIEQSGGTLNLDDLESDGQIIDSLKFIPNPPKMYEVTDKVKVLDEKSLAYGLIGDIIDIDEATMTYKVAFVNEDFDIEDEYDDGDAFYETVSHFKLEPVFD